MDVIEDLAQVAQLIGEPVRAVMLWSLLDGQSRPAGELAFCANVSAQNASAHLARLVEAGLLTVTPQGRHRYYRIATPEVAHAIEAMVALAPSAGSAARLPKGQTPDLRYARTCYDHLAGRVAVELCQALERQQLLADGERAFTVSRAGARWFRQIGIEIDDLQRLRRPLARPCLDWSERRPHLAGALGAALLDQMFRRGWIARVRATRLIRITSEGRIELQRLLKLNL
ncbi:MAG TPA: helix-turn-helix transcriptional regulator [Blastocatellia bacterium]|nr:helix-turn-helix transcriptional regulator [Blastocatellia bacterium]